MKLLFLFVLSTLCVLNVNAQMITESNSSVIKHVEMEADFIVCGGGLSGVCAAVSAARHGTNVILIQDRPVLGGNSSSEMRMGIVGVKNDDSQETGILEEMQMRNFYYNPLQRYTLWDDVIYSTVVSEKNIKLLLNTSVQDVVMDGDRISAVKCWNSNAYTKYLINITRFTFSTCCF
jgi:ribulose 1,5-bisphosphate synthetase/thiazole synthase